MHRIAISNSHRLDPRPRPGTRHPPKDIIVKFVRFRDRALVYSNKRNLKSYNQNPSNSYKIFVNEALTTKRAKLRRCRLDQLIQSCWTYKGNLFVKNPLCQQWKKRQRKCCTYNLNNNCDPECWWNFVPVYQNYSPGGPFIHFSMHRLSSKQLQNYSFRISTGRFHSSRNHLKWMESSKSCARPITDFIRFHANFLQDFVDKSFTDGLVNLLNIKWLYVNQEYFEI